MKIYWLFLIIAPSFLFAQEKDLELKIDSVFTISIGPKLENIICHVTYREYRNEPTIYTFDFYNKLDSTIHFSFTQSVYLIGHYGFEFEDVNHDGYLDLSITVGLTGDGYEIGDIYFYDPQKNNFLPQ